MWLSEEFHGRGIGYTLINQLFDFARAHGYRRVVLQTSRKQTRALAFYARVGFYEIHSYNAELAEVSMEIQLADRAGGTLS
jgi:putative acetyltransferase